MNLNSEIKSISYFQQAIVFLPSNCYQKFCDIYDVSEYGKDKHFDLQCFLCCYPAQNNKRDCSKTKKKKKVRKDNKEIDVKW